jgi:electron transfer flavoprotein alpha subunit
LPTEAVDCDDVLGSQKGKFVENIVAKSEMADLTTAKYVISGGRALKSGENF